MRFILLALLGLSMSGAVSAAPERGRGSGVSQPGPTRAATAPAASSTRGAIARQATSRRPSAQPASRPAASRRPDARPLQRHARGQAARANQTGRANAARGSARPSDARGQGARPAYHTVTRGASRQAAACGRGSRAARCRGETRFAWQSGLPQAAGVQTISCPSGTVETPAHGHTTIMRCLPL